MADPVEAFYSPTVETISAAKVHAEQLEVAVLWMARHFIDNGGSCFDAAEALGCHQATMYRRMRAAGVPVRGPRCRREKGHVR